MHSLLFVESAFRLRIYDLRGKLRTDFEEISNRFYRYVHGTFSIRRWTRCQPMREDFTYLTTSFHLPRPCLVINKKPYLLTHLCKWVIIGSINGSSSDAKSLHGTTMTDYCLDPRSQNSFEFKPKCIWLSKIHLKLVRKISKYVKISPTEVFGNELHRLVAIYWK